ncbi:MotA/TolQ/ExbB proton channel family protein [Saccharophagus degradans]|uniref:MotA/TolQ/ExbB proton channel family protein n=2 Tax=Saccharophagus degradans TaxID=86304 RepID=A0AAW7X3J1_9GAMM|nr:MotA/TolQ/ExbB proton channel family protein [Saccharophagus degradans]MBU2985725.1 MotA/TolQ/ExbB proton channel family protein [Saccharophagus degradans]MDO6421123.1 MotA/TolQ/ExbB proton channel family protein [Saccharophagus degradans]MDO6605966.1 MotA/TolQ/ExbB proton channel family protein [Saccharophagus degradans]WGP00442.1 MotA/TolQ/ExbB proton channel family protein [Saccharophagus degradans]
MFAILASGGWLIMVPLLLCSVAVIAISIERFWTLDPSKIAPKHQLGQVWNWLQNNQLDSDKLKELRHSSQLGRILAAGLSNSRHGREVMKDSIQEAANQVIHDLEKFLGALGTIAAIAPLLGLLGTVIGMIKVFTALNLEGATNAAPLAGGISEALVTTAVGLFVAIPAMMAHRFFVRRVEALVVTLEQEAIKLVDALHNDRRVDMKAA